MSLRNSLTQHNYSSSGFQRIPEKQSGMNTGEVSIPMEPVRTLSKASGSRRPGNGSATALPSLSGTSYTNEKGGYPRPHTHRRNTSQSGEGLNGMGMIYDKIKNFSIVTRYLFYVIPFGILLAVPIVVLSIHGVGLWTPKGYPATHLRWGGVRPLWVFVWIEVWWISLWASKLAAKATPALFQFLCGIVSPGVRKYKSVLKRLEIPISLVIWFAVGIVTFINIIVIDAQLPIAPGSSTYQPTNQYNEIAWAHTFSKVLLAFLISSAVLLGEQFIVQLISISYHHTQYESKIKASKHNVDIVTLLYEASCSLFPAYCPEFAEEDYIINDSIELHKGARGKGHKKSGSATPLRLIQDVGRFGDKVTAVFGNIASEVTGKQVFNPMASHSIVVEALEKRRSCEALARRIWMSLVMEGREALYHDDVSEVLAGHGNYNSDEVFAALDKDGNGDVSLDEMILTVTEIGRERKSVASSLHDVDQAIKVLDRLLLFLVLLIDVFIFILVLSPSLTTSLAGVGTSLLSLSFVFAVTTQEILGSCIFLFVKHPYDVGDRVDIGTQQLTVERISLLYTIFKCVNSGKLTQSPNIVLNTLWVDNISRSGAMKEQLLMNIDFSTTIEDIDLLREQMQSFVLDKENSRDFQSDIIVEVTGVNNMDKMELKVEIRHKSNWHNESLRAVRRSKFMCALVLALRKVPINAPGGSDAGLGSANQPSWSVAISPDDAKAARQAFLDGKAANKLINQQKKAEEEEDAAAAAAASSGYDTKYLAPNTSVRNRKGSSGSGLADGAETMAMNDLNTRSTSYDDFEDSGKGQAGRAPGRLASDDSKYPVRADSQRTREINELYAELQKSPTRGKRRPSVKMNVTAASPTTPNTPMPSMQDRMLSPQDNSFPTEPDYKQSDEMPRRSHSSTRRGYSPLGRETVQHETFVNQATWGSGSLMSPTGAAGVLSPGRPPAPAQGRYVTPPAKAEEFGNAGKTVSGESSWFDRDSATYSSNDAVQTLGRGRDSHGTASARASSLALGSLPEDGDGGRSLVPSEAMPSRAVVGQMHSDSPGISRGKSTNSDGSWAKDDDRHFRLSQARF